MTNLNIIACINNKRYIGKDNRLIYNLPTDLKRFRDLTIGKTVIMGYNTFKSLDFKPLPKRKNIIVYKGEEIPTELYGHILVKQKDLINSLPHLVKEFGELWVIGGATIYRRLLPYVNAMYLTLVNDNTEGDVQFPPFDYVTFNNTEDTQTITENGYEFKFIILKNTKIKGSAV